MNRLMIVNPIRLKVVRILLGTILAIMLLLSAGCVFTPRSPEDPVEVEIEWISPHQPENVLANMEAALEARYITYYRDSLHGEFLFLASAQAIAQQPWDQYFEGFGLERELAATEALFLQVETLQVDWNYDEDPEVVGDEATFSLDNYQLTVVYGDGSERIFSGSAELKLVKDPDWKLIEWDETQNSADNSWGTLRASQEIE